MFTKTFSMPYTVHRSFEWLPFFVASACEWNSRGRLDAKLNVAFNCRLESEIKLYELERDIPSWTIQFKTKLTPLFLQPLCYLKTASIVRFYRKFYGRKLQPHIFRPRVQKLPQYMQASKYDVWLIVNSQ